MHLPIGWLWLFFLTFFQLNAQLSTGCQQVDSLDHRISETELATNLSALITLTDCKQLPHLLLAEDSPIFQGKGSKTIRRIRAWSYFLLAKDTSWHQAIQPFAVADLSNSMDAYVLAAIAQGVIEDKLLSNQPNLSNLLDQSIARIRYRDKPITFQSYFPTDSRTFNYTNAKELLNNARTVITEPVASCCSIPVMKQVQNEDNPSVFDIELTDQDDQTLLFLDYVDRLTVVAFFYTRCENPYKCSATITRLGQLQEALDGLDIRIAGLTYDPRYDQPVKLQKYGSDRGIQFSDDCRLFTYASNRFSALQRHFGLKVSYMSSLVTIHAAEVFVLDKDGKVLYTNDRQNWKVEDVLELLKSEIQIADE